LKEFDARIIHAQRSSFYDGIEGNSICVAGIIRRAKYARFNRRQWLVAINEQLSLPNHNAHAATNDFEIEPISKSVCGLTLIPTFTSANPYCEIPSAATKAPHPGECGARSSPENN
jgi:hypothetical protein